MPRYATMAERLQALRTVTPGALSHQRRMVLRVTGRVTSVSEPRTPRGRRVRMTADAIPREPSKLELAFDAAARKLLALGMTRSELRAKVERGLAEAERARRERRPRP